jgi:polyisoprenoid-binding protein YceI
MNLPARPQKLSPSDLFQRIKSGDDVYLIDTLPGDHFAKVHLPDARNACVYEVTFLEQIQTITTDTAAPLVLYGSSVRSRDAETAAAKLTEAGYSNLCVLDGGIEAWRGAGLPLHGDAADAPDDPETRLVVTDGSYRIDSERSTIKWTGRNAGTTHFGTVGLSGGDIVITGDSFSGTATIDMGTITNINLEGDELQPVLISHLMSDDFFLVKLFPTATFTITQATLLKEPFLTSPNYEVSGKLMLRGVTADKSFLATVTRPAENELAAEAHFDIDRTRWNITYGSTRFFEHLGMHLVFDLISIELRIVAVQN